ncbi:MAG: DUF4124 domain-containing protein [Usitatibacter sp.]
MRKIFLLLAALYVPAAAAAYKCVDEKGVTHIGDTPPAGCANVMMYELSRSGALLRSIEPTPTPEQVKAKLEEAQRKKEAGRIAGEQKRKDDALLSSYSNEREFDVSRDRNIEPLTARIRQNQDRVKAAEKRLQDLEDEMEFYKAGKSKSKTAKAREVPPALVSEQQRVRSERETLEKNIAASEREIAALKVKFDTDKKRWLALKSDPGMRNQQPEPAKATVAGTLIPGAAGIAKCGSKTYECQAGQAYTCKRTDGVSYRVDCAVERK